MGKLRWLLAEGGFGPVVAHAPYIMNPCSKDQGIRELAGEMMAGDLALMEHLPGNYYNFHPGSHVGQGVEAGCEQIAAMLNAVIRPEQQTVVLLETMAGKGSEIGGAFEELRAIIDQVRCREKIGVCMDTCHMSDAGYDVLRDLDGVLAEFDRVVGLERLCAVHINDSQNPPGARKDRHARIGRGPWGRTSLLASLPIRNSPISPLSWRPPTTTRATARRSPACGPSVTRIEENHAEGPGRFRPGPSHLRSPGA